MIVADGRRQLRVHDIIVARMQPRLLRRPVGQIRADEHDPMTRTLMRPPAAWKPRRHYGHLDQSNLLCELIPVFFQPFFSALEAPLKNIPRNCPPAQKQMPPRGEEVGFRKTIPIRRTVPLRDLT